MAKMGVNIVEKAQLIRLEMKPNTSSSTMAAEGVLGIRAARDSSRATSGAFAAAPQHTTMNDIWNAKAIMVQSPLYQPRTIFSGPVGVSARLAMNASNVRMTQKTNESGMIRSAANWNFFDSLQSILTSPLLIIF